MRVLAACSLGGAGHLNPLLPFLAAARRRGDETLVIGPPAVRDMVERTGFPFAAGSEPPESAIAPIRERLPVAPPAEATILGNRELFGRLAATAMLPAMERLCSQWRPDLILRDPCEYASAVFAAERGIRSAQVAISLAEAEAGSIEAAAPALDEHRPGTAAAVRAEPYLTRFPASLDPSPFAATVRFRDPGTSAATALDPAAAPPLPDWWDGSTAPLVYVTFGTVLGHMTLAGDVYRTVLRAVRSLDARVLLTVGRRFDPAQLGPVPANVHVEAWVDQADVLPHADLVVCHGGSGTTFGALAAGVPLVVVPVFADQFLNARRVAAAGAGLTVVAGDESPGQAAPRQPVIPGHAPRSAEATEVTQAATATEAAEVTAAATAAATATEATAAAVTAAVTAVRADATYREAARRIAAEMAAAPTADTVLGDLLAAPRAG